MSTAMSKESGNVGLVVVNEEIESALDLYPDELYKQAFANPELRQKLIDYVMTGIQGIYPYLEHRQGLPTKTKFPYRSLELRLHIENYVHWGIEQLLGVNSDSVGYLINQEIQSQCTPSYL
jgi:hypothetical protein